MMTREEAIILFEKQLTAAKLVLDGGFGSNCNMSLVTCESEENDKEVIKEMLEKHLKYTGSKKAEEVLADFDNEINNFVKVIPIDYKKVVEVMDSELAKGTEYEDAMLIAFENVTGKKVEIA